MNAMDHLYLVALVSRKSVSGMFSVKMYVCLYGNDDDEEDLNWALALKILYALTLLVINGEMSNGPLFPCLQASFTCPKETIHKVKACPH